MNSIGIRPTKSINNVARSLLETGDDGSDLNVGNTNSFMKSCHSISYSL
jgi:hypothetical protein